MRQKSCFCPSYFCPEMEGEVFSPEPLCLFLLKEAFLIRFSPVQQKSFPLLSFLTGGFRTRHKNPACGGCWESSAPFPARFQVGSKCSLPSLFHDNGPCVHVESLFEVRPVWWSVLLVFLPPLGLLLSRQVLFQPHLGASRCIPASPVIAGFVLWGVHVS